MVLVPKPRWTIRPLNSTTYLIRETDDFREYPHIYARLVYSTEASINTTEPETIDAGHKSKQEPCLIILSDTGSGTSVAFRGPTRASPARESRSLSWRPVSPAASEPRGKPGSVSTEDRMTLYSFLSTQRIGSLDSKPLNPGNKIPYLVATSHCHYDHILGLHFFPTVPSSSSARLSAQDMAPGAEESTPPVTVLSSAHDPSFITPPFPNLNSHSQCDKMGLQLPDYEIGYWARDGQEIRWPPPDEVKTPSVCTDPAQFPKVPASSVGTGVYTYHTPGHTPDSLSLYDSNTRHLYIGDSIYERESPDSRSAGEPPMPIVFDECSNLSDWFSSVDKLLDLTRTLNRQKGDRPWVRPDEKELIVEVQAAVHVTCRQSKKRFLGRLQSPDTPEWWIRVQNVEGEKDEWMELDPSIELSPAEPTTGSETWFGIVPVEGEVDPEMGICSNPPNHAWKGLQENLNGCRSSDLPDRSIMQRAPTRRILKPVPPSELGLSTSSSTFSVHHPAATPSPPPSPLPRVKAGAAHVTAEADAENLLVSARLFVDWVVQGKIPGKKLKKNPYGDEELWYWSWEDGLRGGESRRTKGAALRTKEELARFAVQAPLRLVEEERERRRGCDGGTEAERIGYFGRRF